MIFTSVILQTSIYMIFLGLNFPALPRAIELIRVYIVRVESLKESPGDKVIEVSESEKNDDI